MSVKKICYGAEAKCERSAGEVMLTDLFDGDVIIVENDLCAIPAKKQCGIYVRPRDMAKSSRAAAKIIADAEKAEKLLAVKKREILMRIKKLIASLLFASIFSLILSFFSFGISSGFVPVFFIMLAVFIIYFEFKCKIIRRDIK